MALLGLRVVSCLGLSGGVLSPNQRLVKWRSGLTIGRKLREVKQSFAEWGATKTAGEVGPVALDVRKP
jgi:hypothetical protein